MRNKEESKTMKENIFYRIFNPGGNVTALVNGCEYSDNKKKWINQMIMKKNPTVEQVGFLSKDEYRLEMAGGEFCLNATRCAIFAYNQGGEYPIPITVSGTSQEMLGRVMSDGKVTVEMKLNKRLSDLLEVKNGFTLVKIEGILIAVMDEERSKELIIKLKENEAMAKAEMKQWMQDNLVTEEKAIGVMLLEKVGNITKINPVVWVKEIDTVFYETACGSGSLATSIYTFSKTKNTKASIMQPSGYVITVELTVKDDGIQAALVSGMVNEEPM